MVRLIAIAAVGALVGFAGSNATFQPAVDDDPSLPLTFEEPPTEAMRSALKRSIDVEFKDAPLEAVVQQISKQIGVSIHLDVAALANAMVDRDQPVTVSLKNVRTLSVLRTILDPLNLTVEERPDHLRIVDKESLRHGNIVRFYPVADLVLNRTGGWLDPDGAAIAQIIMDTIDRDIWEPNGGDGTITFYLTGIALVINVPKETHWKVQDMLGMLRQIREQTARLLERHNLPAIEEALVQMDKASVAPIGFFSPPNYPPASKVAAAFERIESVDMAQQTSNSKLFQLEQELQQLKAKLESKKVEPPVAPIPLSDEPPAPKKKRMGMTAIFESEAQSVAALKEQSSCFE